MTTETMTQYVRADHASREFEAEQLLREAVQEGRTDLLTSERAFLAREMNWDEAETRRQLRRVSSILRLQAIAGSPADREAALQECQTATDLHAKQGPAIEAKIQELQQKLRALERDSSTAQRRCEQQHEAVASLRQLCPDHIRERVQRAVAAVEAGVGQDLRDAKARHRELVCVLNLDDCHGGQKKHLDSLRLSLPEAVHCNTVNRQNSYAYSQQWPMLRAECEQEYASLTERLPVLQSEYDQQIATAEGPLDFYSDPKNQQDY